MEVICGTDEGRRFAPCPTPDGKWVIYNSTQSGRDFLWRIPIDGGQATRISDQACLSPSISPDGKLIACGFGESDDMPAKLAIVKVEDGTVVKLFDVASSGRFTNGLRWMPDGLAISYRDGDNGVWRQNLSGGKPTKLPGLPEEQVYSYAWSSDGKLFAVTRGRAISDVVLLRDTR